MRVRSQGTPGRRSSRVEAETRRSRSGDEVEVESEGEAIVEVRGGAAAAPSLLAAAKALVVELISLSLFLSLCRRERVEESAENEVGQMRSTERKGERERTKEENKKSNRWPRRREKWLTSTLFLFFLRRPAAFSPFDSLAIPAESPLFLRPSGALWIAVLLVPSNSPFLRE